MSKKMIILSVIALLALGIFLKSIKAQKYPEEESFDFSEEFRQIEEKIDKLSTILDKTDKEILKKLDSVLSNQQKMIEELKIIKIRASR